MNLDRRQQAAALHGSAENRAYAVTDRLGYALAACDLYAELLEAATNQTPVLDLDPDAEEWQRRRNEEGS